jgi:hypothetical protein
MQIFDQMQKVWLENIMDGNRSEIHLRYTRRWRFMLRSSVFSFKIIDGVITQKTAILIRFYENKTENDKFY